MQEGYSPCRSTFYLLRPPLSLQDSVDLLRALVAFRGPDMLQRASMGI